MIGFCDSDKYTEVVTKAAKGLEVKCSIDDLFIICSGGRVPDLPISEKPWTLGSYIEHNGGTSNRSRRLWGLYVPSDLESDVESTSMPICTRDSVSK